MADASGRDLGQFMRWYAQAGTPELKVRRSYDPARQAYTLEIGQSTPPTPGQPEKLPFHIPIRMGLVGPDGAAQPLQLEGENEPKGTDRVLELTEPTQRFTFLGLERSRCPRCCAGSPPRSSSTPATATTSWPCSWRTTATRSCAGTPGQRLASNVLLALVREHARAGAAGPLDRGWSTPSRATWTVPARIPAFAARALSLPSSGYLGQQMAVIDVEGIRHASTMPAASWAAPARRLARRLPRATRRRAVLDRDRRHGAPRAQEPGAGLPRPRRRRRRAGLARAAVRRADNMTDSLPPCG